MRVRRPRCSTSSPTTSRDAARSGARRRDRPSDLTAVRPPGRAAASAGGRTTPTSRSSAASTSSFQVTAERRSIRIRGVVGCARWVRKPDAAQEVGRHLAAGRRAAAAVRRTPRPPGCRARPGRGPSPGTSIRPTPPPRARRGRRTPSSAAPRPATPGRSRSRPRPGRTPPARRSRSRPARRRPAPPGRTSPTRAAPPRPTPPSRAAGSGDPVAADRVAAPRTGRSGTATAARRGCPRVSRTAVRVMTALLPPMVGGHAPAAAASPERMAPVRPDPAEQEAPQRPLRRARADPGRGAAARGRGPPDPQAQHRQPGAVRVRGARGDRRRHGPPPARGAGLQRLPGHLPRPYGGRAVLPAARAARRHGRGRLHRQRRLRADLDGAAGVRRRRQRDPGARRRTTRCGPARSRSPAGRPCTTCATRTNDWNPDLADIESKITENTHALVIINPNNPTGAVYSQRDRSRGWSTSPGATSSWSSPTRSTRRSSSTTRSTTTPPRRPAATSSA